MPEESVKVLKEVRDLVDSMSKEAIRLGQLSPEAYERNKFAYLRRSYLKHTAELTGAEAKGRARAIAILGDQYKRRGMTDAVDMAKFKNAAPEWWNRKTQQGKADKQLKGRSSFVWNVNAPAGAGTSALQGFGEKQRGRLLEVAYWPAGEPIPARYGSWGQSGTWEVRDTKGGKLVVWRDFTKQEREAKSGTRRRPSPRRSTTDTPTGPSTGRTADDSRTSPGRGTPGCARSATRFTRPRTALG
ncbi:MAG: hypothetical protein IPJ52_09475 [Rhodocyclaceae bacterium]|nr:hypothetical protein [Rhodocyclaceae bacterium]